MVKCGKCYEQPIPQGVDEVEYTQKGRHFATLIRICQNSSNCRFALVVCLGKKDYIFLLVVWPVSISGTEVAVTIEWQYRITKKCDSAISGIEHRFLGDPDNIFLTMYEF